MKPVELALDVAMIVMENGGNTKQADRTFQNILKGYTKEGISATWRLDYVVADSGEEEQISTVLRPIGAIGTNLARTSAAVVLGERVARGEIDTAGTMLEIERIKAIPSPYNRWVMVAGAIFAAAACSQTSGGDWGALGLAVVAAGVGQFFRLLLQSMKLMVAPVTLIIAVLSTCIVGVGLRLGISQTAPAAWLSSIIYMLPGIPLINGFLDILSHTYMFVGLQRIAYAAFICSVLAVAVAFVFTIVM